MKFSCKHYCWNTDRQINLDNPNEYRWDLLDILGSIAEEPGAKAIFQVCKKNFLWFERPLNSPRELNVAFQKSANNGWDFTGPDAQLAKEAPLEYCTLFALSSNTIVEQFLKSEFLKSSDGWLELNNVAKSRGYSANLLRVICECLSICKERKLFYVISFGHDLDQLDYFDLTK